MAALAEGDPGQEEGLLPLLERFAEADLHALDHGKAVQMAEEFLMDAAQLDLEKLKVLKFFGENCREILDKKELLEKVCAVLNDLLYQEFSTESVKCEVLTTLTTIVIALDVFVAQPTALETLVEVILSFAEAVNEGDVLLRLCACACLVELEETYPLLLASHVAHFMNWAQKETSIAFQGYAAVLNVVVHHKLLELSESDRFNTTPTAAVAQPPLSGEVGDDESLFGVKATEGYQLPSRYKASSVVGDAVKGPHELLNFDSVTAPLLVHAAEEEDEARAAAARVSLTAEHAHRSAVELQRLAITRPFVSGAKDARRALHFLAELASHHLVPWHAAATALRIGSLLDASGVKRDLLKLRFGGFSRSSHPLLLHAWVLMLPKLTEDMRDVQGVLMSCFSSVVDGEASEEARVLVAQWLLDLLPSETFNKQLIAHRRLFLPSLFDPLLLQEIRLQCTELSSMFLPSTDIPSALGESLRALRVLADFRFEDLRSPSPRWWSLARVLVHTLLESDLRGRSSEVVRPVCEYMEQVLARLPRVAMALVQVLEAVTEAVPSVVPAVCNHLADFIVSSAQADHEVDPEALSAARSEFVYCLPLIQYLVGNLAVQAAPLLSSVLRFVRASDVCERGVWSAGTRLLDMAHGVATSPRLTPSSSLTPSLHAESAVVYELLASLLSHLEAHFHHVDIRDRAHLYYSLLTHVSPLTAQRVMLQKSSATTHSHGPAAVALPEPLFVSPSRAVAEQLVQPLHEELLLIERIHSDRNDVAATAAKAIVATKDVTSWPNLMADYLAVLSAPDSKHNEIAVSLECRLNATLQSQPRQLFSLNFSFSPASSAILQPLEPISVHMLESADGGNASGFSVSSQVLRLRPLVPLPTSVHVKVQYNDEEGRVHHGVLPSIELAFSDYLLPLPIPATENAEVASLRPFVFTELWRTILDDALGAEALLLVDLASSASVQRIMTFLGPFMISRSADGTTENVRVAAYLPQRHHVLLQIHVQDRQTTISYRVSHWLLVPHLDQWLRRSFAKLGGN